jgi:hypothetical protein
MRRLVAGYTSIGDCAALFTRSTQQLGPQLRKIIPTMAAARMLRRNPTSKSIARVGRGEIDGLLIPKNQSDGYLHCLVCLS